MRRRVLLAQLRELAASVASSGDMEDEDVLALEGIQDQLAALAEDYETEDVPAGAEGQRTRMLEALGQIHRGLEQFMTFLDSGQIERLQEGIVTVEAGFDLLDRLESNLLDDGEAQASAPLL